MLCFTDYLPSQSEPAGWENIILKLISIGQNDENSCYQFSSVTQPYLFLFFALRCNNKGAKSSSQQHLPMFLSLITALNHFITMLNHSNNELSAISIIFMSCDFGNVIYIFIYNMELRDPAASVKHKINLVRPNYACDYISRKTQLGDYFCILQLHIYHYD